MASGTVTYIDGDIVGINSSGEKAPPDYPATMGPADRAVLDKAAADKAAANKTGANDKDVKLKTESTLNVKTAKITVDGKAAKIADVHNGDNVSTTGPDNAVETASFLTEKGGADASEARLNAAKAKVEEANLELKQAEKEHSRAPKKKKEDVKQGSPNSPRMQTGPAPHKEKEPAHK